MKAQRGQGRNRQPVEWIGHRLVLDALEKEPIELVAWLEEPSCLVLHERLHDVEPGSLGEALRDVLARPPKGAARVPDLIRVATPELADEVRGAIGALIPVIVEATPEFSLYLEDRLEQIAEKFGLDWDSPVGQALLNLFDAELEEVDLQEPPPPAPRAGRNDPCPCGSDRKFKHCCLGKETAAAAMDHARARAHQRDEHLVNQLLGFGLERFADEFRSFEDDFQDARKTFQLALPWAVYARHVRRKPLVEWFLQERAARLAPEDRAWLEAQRAAWLSIWAVTGVRPGRSIGLIDIISGQIRNVAEASASELLVAGDAILARVVDHDGLALLCGVHPHPLPPSRAMAVAERAQKRLRRRRPVPVERLRDEGFGRYLIRQWEKTVEEHYSRPRELRNTDGEQIILTTDYFDIVPGGASAVEAALADLPLAQPPEPDDEERVFTFLKPGNEMHREWENTVIGIACVHQDTLEVQTNSRERADSLRESIELACRDRIRHRERAEIDPRDSFGGTPPPRRPEPPEAQQLALEFKRQHYAGWVDESIPALDGLTPRQAAQTKEGRNRLDLLLQDMQQTENRAAGDAAFDFAEVRRELGLE